MMTRAAEVITNKNNVDSDSKTVYWEESAFTGDEKEKSVGKV